VFASVAIDLLLIVTRPLREVDALAHKIGKLLCHEAVDPRKRRPGLLEAVEGRTHQYRT
jgi:hypothetical protein